MAMKKVTRTEANNLLNIESIKNTSNITIKDTDEGDPFGESFYFNNIYDEKEMKAFIKAVEKNVRKSTYYSDYIGKLNENGIINCAILGNVSKDQVTVEMHHFPFTLYDIVQIHMVKNIETEKKMNTFSVAKEVIQDHFDNIVPLVPLCKTAHELVHTGDAAVSLKQIFGNIREFVNKYENYMSDELKIKYNKIVELSENSDKLYKGNTMLDSVEIKINNDNDVIDLDF